MAGRGGLPGDTVRAGAEHGLIAYEVVRIPGSGAFAARAVAG